VRPRDAPRYSLSVSDDPVILAPVFHSDGSNRSSQALTRVCRDRARPTPENRATVLLGAVLRS